MGHGCVVPIGPRGLPGYKVQFSQVESFDCPLPIDPSPAVRVAEGISPATKESPDIRRL